MVNSRTPLTSREEDALNHLEQYIDEPADDEHRTRENAVASITEHEFERAVREHSVIVENRLN
ncbi:hypothetical protein [Haloarcula marina]|uniref:hypothetical protein n=1 Tax=Haloarcula marina TaxID=2961574 RepID=UPI0020B63979|nr:hypothetical protein [Halomicroarcula marina]